MFIARKFSQLGVRAEVALALLAVSFLLAAPAALGETTDTTVTLTSGEWPPFTSKELRRYGVFSDIVTQAFALEGYEVKYVFMPWKRAYNLARDGEFDGSLTWAATPERRKDFHFSDPVTHNSKTFFHLVAKDFDWASITDLQRFRFGTTRHYTYGDEFDNAVTNGQVRVEVVDSDRQNILKLHADRIDAFPMSIDVGYYLIGKTLDVSKAQAITHHQKPLQVTPVSVTISRKIDKDRAQALVLAINNGLARLRESGRHEQMLRLSREGGYLIEAAD